MVDKVLPAGGDPMNGLGSLPEASPVELSPADDPTSSLQTDEAGNVTITYQEPPDIRTVPHDANLAEYLPDATLGRICSELIQAFQDDKLSRWEWEEAYRKGIELLGIKIEDRTFPFKGACGVVDPMIGEAVVRFQSNAIMEIFPEGGPARSKILGKLTPEKQDKAQRVEDYINYLLTEKMSDYRSETEKLLFSLGLCGAAFRKVYPDPEKMMPEARFVPAEQFIVPYGSTSLDKAPRYTEILKQTKNDILKLQASGFYRDVEFGEPMVDRDSLEYEKAKIGKQSLPVREEFYTTLEMHVDLDIEGLEDLDPDTQEPTGVALPYIVTIQKDSQQVLSIYRNWDESDPKHQKQIWYSDYSYIPGVGFYGLGLIHLVGGLAKGATSILRQLIDAGTLANLRGGFKTRGLRIRGDDSPIAPGEWRDVDVPTGKIEDNIFPLPYGEPSNVLLQLMGILSDSGRRLGSIADVEIGDIGAQAPVGTTLSIMERAMKVMSAVQARLHESMHNEFRILVRVIKMVTPEQYPYDVEGGSRVIKAADFDSTVDVVPVSNPNAATMSQRVTQYQAAYQIAQANPQAVNFPALLRRMMGVLGIPNVREIVPDKSDVPPADPVTENGNLINGVPAKAYDWQDHQAHIATHVAFIKDPKIAAMIGQNPQAPSIMGALQAHVTDHLQYQYRRDLEKQLGVPLPPFGQPIPPEVESQLSAMVAQAAQQLLARDQQEAAAQQAAQQAQDPVLQLQKQELQLQAAKLQQDAQVNQAKLAADAAAKQQAQQTERMRIAAQMKADADRISAQQKQADDKLTAQLLKQQQDMALKLKQMENENAKSLAEIHEILARIAQGMNAGKTRPVGAE